MIIKCYPKGSDYSVNTFVHIEFCFLVLINCIPNICNELYVSDKMYVTFYAQ
jgi:hypothetical protein